MTRYFTYSLCALVFHAASKALADEVITDDLIVTGNLCTGLNCSASEGFGGSAFQGTIKLDSISNLIWANDTSPPFSGSAETDWRLYFNEPVVFGREAFYISDWTNETDPFWIMAGAPTSSLVVGPSGNIGIGTQMPTSDLHIVSSQFPAVRLESNALFQSEWVFGGDYRSFLIQNSRTGQVPLEIDESAPSHSLRVDEDGNVGVGTFFPRGRFHVRGPDTQISYFESQNSGAVQIRLRSNSQNRRFLAVNNTEQVKSQIIFRDNDILFAGETDSGANRWLTIGPNGIVSQGPTCSSPCDQVFEPDVFTIPDIEERAAYMWDNKHLPAIGPTSPDQPMNLTEKMGGVIHELEVAHIYIEELHEQLKSQASAIEELRQSNARLYALIADSTD